MVLKSFVITIQGYLLTIDFCIKSAVLYKTEFFFKNFLCLWLLNAFGVSEKNNLTARILETKWDMNKFIQFFPDFFMMMWLSKDEEKTTSTSTWYFPTISTIFYCCLIIFVYSWIWYSIYLIDTIYRECKSCNRNLQVKKHDMYVPEKVNIKK